MGIRIEFNEGEYLNGLNDVTEQLQEKVDKLKKKSVQGLKDALIYVASESQQKAPVEFGDLRGSVLVEIDDVKIAEGTQSGLSEEEKQKRRESGELSSDSGLGINIVSEEVPENGTTGRVSYNTVYAAVQHEQINYAHPRGGQAKYLQQVLTDEQDRILKIIAEEMWED